MSPGPAIVFGTGHLAQRMRRLVAARGHAVIALTHEAIHAGDGDMSAFDAIGRAVASVDLATVDRIFLVDDRDERNLEMLIALIALRPALPIVATLFNENVAPHLQAAHPNVRVLNPAKIAAATFIDALDAPLERTLRYAPAPMPVDPVPVRTDRTIARLVVAFAVLVLAAVTYFHVADGLSWLDAVYFVVVTVATVGYGDINLQHASATSKIVGIGLILASTCFIWMIFSLTVDAIIKRRVQLALGRKSYDLRDHVILCGLGRLGTFIAEGLLQRGTRVVIVESNDDLPSTTHLRSLGADVYVGDARQPRVLRDVGVTRARALYSVVNNDFVNLEVGLNARSFAPGLRLILRIFDESMTERVRDHLDIHLTYSMSAIADQIIFDALPARS